MLLLSQQEDPYFFKERLTMPKLVVNAVLDEFQQPDDSIYWWNDMPNPKHFIMTPNAEHSMSTGILEVVPAISAFLNYHLRNEVVPTWTWTINNSTGQIDATLDEHGVVFEANVYHATSCGANNGNSVNDGVSRRDFRVAMMDAPCSCGMASGDMCTNLQSLWHKEPLVETIVRGRRTYSALVEAPTDGKWVAFFIDIRYRRPKGEEEDLQAGLLPKDLAGRLEFTTAVSILPMTFPYPECSGASCGNNLV